MDLEKQFYREKDSLKCKKKKKTFAKLYSTPNIDSQSSL